MHASQDTHTMVLTVCWCQGSIKWNDRTAPQDNLTAHPTKLLTRRREKRCIIPLLGSSRRLNCFLIDAAAEPEDGPYKCSVMLNSMREGTKNGKCARRGQAPKWRHPRVRFRIRTAVPRPNCGQTQLVSGPRLSRPTLANRSSHARARLKI